MWSIKSTNNIIKQAIFPTAAQFSKQSLWLCEIGLVNSGLGPDLDITMMTIFESRVAIGWEAFGSVISLYKYRPQACTKHYFDAHIIRSPPRHRGRLLNCYSRCSHRPICFRCVNTELHEFSLYRANQFAIVGTVWPDNIMFRLLLVSLVNHKSPTSSLKTALGHWFVDYSLIKSILHLHWHNLSPKYEFKSQISRWGDSIFSVQQLLARYEYKTGTSYTF